MIQGFFGGFEVSFVGIRRSTVSTNNNGGSSGTAAITPRPQNDMGFCVGGWLFKVFILALSAVEQLDHSARPALRALAEARGWFVAWAKSRWWKLLDKLQCIAAYRPDFAVACIHSRSAYQASAIAHNCCWHSSPML
ncbi:hypothetical protein V4R08_07990 [Nitrobacter sp. NHB1]|uniref:hypothetical protein n=1 Tax=Nitrobacter sp. NHB1 TaxID=3119830 RepID=UPI00300068AE